MNLRAACIHRRYEAHPLGSGRDLLTAQHWCPGGREITIDYEAAIATINLSSHGFVGDKYIVAAIDAAIGDGDYSREPAEEI